MVAEAKQKSPAEARGKDAAVSAARQLGREVLKVQVKRSSGKGRTIAEFEVYADEAAEWIKRAKEVPTQAVAPLKPTVRLTAAMGQHPIGPFKTKEELFDALEASDDG